MVTTITMTKVLLQLQLLQVVGTHLLLQQLLHQVLFLAKTGNFENFKFVLDKVMVGSCQLAGFHNFG